MKLTATQMTVSERPAGPRLRCFLGVALVACIEFLTAGVCIHAMTCVTPRVVHVARLQGEVFDPSGVPIP
jgi:hypothetical protein